MKNKPVTIFLAVLLTGALAITYNTEKVWAEGPIYIRPDGSVDPPTAPIQRDGDVYTFTGNINETIVVQRDHITVDGNGYMLQGAGSGKGFDLSNRNNVTIKKTHITKWYYGVYVYNLSSSNVISSNNLTENIQRAIFVSNSSSNVISGNEVVNNIKDGIFLYLTNKTTVASNNVSNNGEDGISIGYRSFNNTVINNTVFNNTQAGISFPIEISTGNIITGNNITENAWAGIYMSWATASNNRFYHNNLNNTLQVFTVEATNTWDNGYPSGGNYWSDYTGTDLHSGPYQNETGSDGIGDTPYDIDTNNQDNYPFMNPWTPQAYDIATVNVTPSKTVVGQGYALHINVTVTNQGSYAQTFNVTVYANTTVIETKTVTLESGNSATVTFTWNTTSIAYGNYTISAYATLVPGEVDTADNTLEDGMVLVTVTGDVNGDSKVDASDLFDLGKAYGSNPSKPNWNPNCDFNGDGKVDASDLFDLSKNYGKIWL